MCEVGYLLWGKAVHLSYKGNLTILLWTTQYRKHNGSKGPFEAGFHIRISEEIYFILGSATNMKTTAVLQKIDWKWPEEFWKTQENYPTI